MSLKTKNMFLCSYVLMSLKQKHVLMFLCLKTKNMSSYPYVLKQKHVLMFLCLKTKNMSSCPYVLKQKTCSYVLMS